MGEEEVLAYEANKHLSNSCESPAAFIIKKKGLISVVYFPLKVARKGE